MSSTRLVHGGLTAYPHKPWGHFTHSPGPPPTTWLSKSSLSRPRYMGYAFFINGKIWVVGGCNIYPDGNFALSDVAWDIELYDPTQDKWTPQPSPFSKNAVLPMFGSIGSKIYAFGGEDPSTFAYGSPASADYAVQEYDTVTKQLRVIKAPIKYWTRSYDAAVATANNRIYVFGGYNGSADTSHPNAGFFDTIQEFDGSRWNVKKSRLARLRFDAAAATTKTSDGNDVVVIMGGFTRNGCFDADTTVEIYDPKTDTIKTGKDMPNWVDSPTAVTTSDGTVYVLGGHCCGPQPYVQAYAGDSWTACTPFPVPRFWHMSAVAVTESQGERIFIIGGCSGPNQVFASVVAGSV